jgi:hypothetical protein
MMLSRFWEMENARHVAWLWRIAESTCSDRGNHAADLGRYLPIRMSAWEHGEAVRLWRWRRRQARWRAGYRVW